MHAGCTFSTSSQNYTSHRIRHRSLTTVDTFRGRSFSTAPEKLLMNRGGPRLCWAAEPQLVLLCAAESVHFSGMPNHLRLEVCSLSDTVVAPPAVWCRWPKTLSLFHHCTHSISELPTKKNKSESRPASSPLLWLLAFYETVLLSCFVLLCYEIVLQELGRLLPLRGLIDWQLWCCMKSRFDWWGLRPSGSLAGGALRELRLYGRSVLLNGAHFELSALLSGWQWTYNKCTSSSVCATSTTRTVVRKNPGGLHGGAWGCKQERKTEGKKRYGEQSEGERNDTKGQRERQTRR